MVRAPSQPPARQLIALLINEIAESTRPFVLIVDDYHVITSEEVQDAVQQLLQLMPANMSLILTSRREPALPTLRMNARGELVELGALDLSFTAEEAREFFFERQQLDLQRSEVDAIQRWAEGWPVALRLVAGALRGRSQERVQALLEALTDNVPSVSDYLWDEAIGSQSTERSTFLLRSAILRQFNPDVAGVVTEMPNAEELLNGLYRDNLFIARLYGPGSWYRYHHLFAELLRARLQETQPELVPVLHRRAADWHEQAGFATEAVHHALATRDMAFAAESIERAILRTATWSRVDTALIQSWLNALPAEAVEPRPWLRLFLSRIQYVSGQRELAGQTLQSLEKWLQDHPTTPEAKRLLNLTVVDRASYDVVLGLSLIHI